MKYLSNYVEEGQTKVYNETGAFFAFSNEQFAKSKKEGVTYVSCGSGLLCPKENVERLINGLDEVFKKGVAQDVEENGIDKIIERELWNHEAGYTGEIEDTCDVLEIYGITRDQVLKVYRSIDWDC